jgi:hypothetical protein
MVEAAVTTSAGIEVNPQPYPPSWIDRFTDWVDRLPGPNWLFYVGLGLFLYLVEVAIQWSTGAWGQLYPFQFVYVNIIPYALALIHYLDHLADTTLHQFRPALTCSETDIAELRYRLTTMPPLPTLLASLMGLVLGFLMFSAIPVSVQLQVSHATVAPLSVVFNQAIALGANIITFILFPYHTWHQLRLASEIYARYTRVDLFNLGPLYAFSTLSAYTAVGILPLAYAWIVFVPELLSQIPILGVTAIFTLFAAFTFIRPLTGIHRLLANEKGRLLAESSQRLKTTIAELHRRVDSGEMVDMDNLNKAMVSLEIEHAALGRISTWPWQPDTPRLVLAALLFPVIVWLLQWLLQRFLAA